MPSRPLPVGSVPAWLLGPFCWSAPPLIPVPPSRVQFVAELIRHGDLAEAHHSAHSSRLAASAARGSRPARGASTNWGAEVTGACSTNGLNPSLRLPVGDKRAIRTATVSAPNRSKRGNCCSPLAPKDITLMPKYGAGFTCLRPPDALDVSSISAQPGCPRMNAHCVKVFMAYVVQSPQEPASNPNKRGGLFCVVPRGLDAPGIEVYYGITYNAEQQRRGYDDHNLQSKQDALQPSRLERNVQPSASNRRSWQGWPEGT